MEISTVPGQHVLTLLALAESRGLSRDDLLSGAQIPASVLESKTAPVPLRNFIALANTLMVEMDDESCGMLPTPVKPGSFVLLCQSCMDCKTLGHFLRRRIKTLALINSDIQMDLRQDGENAYYEVKTPTQNRSSLGQHITIILLALAHRVSCWTIRDYIPINSVDIIGKKNRRARDYDYLLNFSINYEQERNQLCFPAEYLDRPILQDRESMEQFLKAPAYYLMSGRGVRHSLSYEIRKLLEDSAVGDFPSLEDVAERFNLSVATLRRRLREEGTTYQDLKDDIRRDFAINVLLREGNVKAAAYASGFSEPTSFFRAFKRWTGTTPKAYIS